MKEIFLSVCEYHPKENFADQILIAKLNSKPTNFYFFASSKHSKTEEFPVNFNQIDNSNKSRKFIALNSTKSRSSEANKPKIHLSSHKFV